MTGIFPPVSNGSKTTARSPRGARIRTRHRQMDTEFIQKPQPQRRQSHLFLGERGPLLRAGSPGAAGLFLSVKSICCKPRQTVLILTLTRQRRRSNSRSSSKVASGNSATNPANSSNFETLLFNIVDRPDARLLSLKVSSRAETGLTLKEGRDLENSNISKLVSIKHKGIDLSTEPDR
jgi:hypothetical protein